MSIIRTITSDVNEILQSCGDKVTYEQKRDMLHKHIVSEVSNRTKELVDAFNGSHSESVIDGMLQGIVGSHRYLQGEFWIGMRKLVEKYSQLDESMYFDGRNQFARQMCERMKSGADND